MNRIITPDRGLILPNRGIITPPRNLRLPYERVPFSTPWKRKAPFYADVAHVGTDGSGKSTTNNTTATFTITIDTPTNGIIVVIVGWIDAQAGSAAVSSVASASNTLALLASSGAVLSGVDGADWGTSIYYKVAPTAESATFTVTMTENTGCKFIGGGCFNNVDQTTPFGTPTTGTGTTGATITASLTGTSASGMLVGGLLSFASGSTQDVAVSTPATQMWEQEEQVFEGSSMAMGYSAGVADIVFTRESSTAYLYSAVELKAVGGAAGVTIPVIDRQYRARW